MNPGQTLRNGFRSLVALLASVLALHGQTLNVLHSFGHHDLGYQPESGVSVGPNGELYGTTPFGGAQKLGLAYEILPPASPGAAWTEAVLHSFSAGAGDGAPTLGLLVGPGGALYGTTEVNGAGVFVLKPPVGTGIHWREVVLHAFTDSNGDGSSPSATPILGPGGALYGTTSSGGSSTGGALFRLVPPRAQGGTWAEQILYSFPGYAGDGSEPFGSLALGSDGTIYGTTKYGGADTLGTVFQLTPPASPGGAWTESLLYSFPAAGGSGSPNGVVLGSAGVLYGSNRGANSARQCSNGIPCGTVFQLAPPEAPGGPWTETTLHTFTGFPNGDGTQPNSTPVLGPGGALYGTTAGGGTAGLVGTIYEMVPPPSPGGAWTEVILYSFPESGANGVGPNAVTLGPDGNLYGTTIAGGAHKLGTVFQLVLQ
jgi:uncharacterized repeat protein (TIGR03803 family)